MSNHRGLLQPVSQFLWIYYTILIDNRYGCVQWRLLISITNTSWINRAMTMYWYPSSKLDSCQRPNKFSFIMMEKLKPSFLDFFRGDFIRLPSFLDQYLSLSGIWYDTLGYLFEITTSCKFIICDMNLEFRLAIKGVFK